MEKDQVLELTIANVAQEGRGVARTEGFVVFTDRGLPGEQVRARVTRVRKSFAEAEVLETLAPGPHAVDAPCPHFGPCGGCAWQNMDYAAQLAAKQSLVADALARIGGVRDCEVAPTLPSPNRFHFRNKMEFAVSGTGDSLRLGLRRRGSHEVLNVDGCLLMQRPCADVVHALREHLAATGLPAHAAARGHWRYAVVRKSATEAGLVVQLIAANVTEAVREIAEGVGNRLLEQFPEVTGFVLGSRDQTENVAYSEHDVFTLGNGRLGETLYPHDDGPGLRYEFGTGTFFQTNTAAAELLYRTALDAAGLSTGSEPGFSPTTVWDLYAGCGGITLFLARALPHARIAGVESGREAVEDAEANARANGLAHCVFVPGDLRRVLQRRVRDGGDMPQLVVLDPPRGGMHADVRRALLATGAERLVYVSCDPATMARDVKALSPDYAVVNAQPVDLFPHAPHVESVIALHRRR